MGKSRHRLSFILARMKFITAAGKSVLKLVKFQSIVSKSCKMIKKYSGAKLANFLCIFLHYALRKITTFKPKEV